MYKDLYDLPTEELVDVPTVATSLEDAVNHLRTDHEFLLQGDVFSNDFIKSYIDLCEQDIAHIRSLVHPFEFELYYSS
jgi:glutamine synthetase